jgi:hypothetical protein
MLYFKKLEDDPSDQPTYAAVEQEESELEDDPSDQPAYDQQYT